MSIPLIPSLWRTQGADGVPQPVDKPVGRRWTTPPQHVDPGPLFWGQPVGAAVPSTDPLRNPPNYTPVSPHPQRRHDAGKPGFPQDPHYLLQLQPVPYHEIEPGCQRRRRGHSMPGRRRCRDPGHMALASPRAPSRYHHATGGRTRSPGEPGAGEPGARRRPSPKAARHEDAGNQADVRGEGRRKGAS